MQRRLIWTLVLCLSSLSGLHADEDHLNLDDLDLYQRDSSPQLPAADEWDMFQRPVHAELPPPEEWGFYQRELTHEDMLQREIIPEFPHIEQKEVEVPLLIHGEPFLSPRGRRPTSDCHRKPCPSGTQTAEDNNVADFPPGRPSQRNIGNICDTSRPKPAYGPHDLPRTGFSHLRRQGNAINNLEEGYAQCCQKKDPLRCAEGVWKSTLQAFCTEEFGVKTSHYHCCRKQRSERETCFSSNAPNPSYSFLSLPVPLQEIGSADVPTLGRSRSLKPCPSSSPKCQKELHGGLPDLSFPPGEPKSSNIQNICKLRKFRPVYPKNQRPQDGYGHYTRQAKAINHMESDWKKCCKDENVACAHSAWEKALIKFCLQEQTVKTRHYECCKKRERADMYSCFAMNAPYPEYDREVESMDLSNVTQDHLQKLCGDSKLLTKQKQIPLLVSGLRDSCCNVSRDAALQCADAQREKFLENLCGSKKAAWKDSQSCCEKRDEEKAECFNAYLRNVSVAFSHRKKPEK